MNISVCFAVFTILGLRSARGVNASIDPAQAGIVMAILFGMWIIFVGTIFAVKKTHPQSSSKIYPDNEKTQFVTSDGQIFSQIFETPMAYHERPSKNQTPISNPYLTTRVYRDDTQFIQGRVSR